MGNCESCEPSKNTSAAQRQAQLMKYASIMRKTQHPRIQSRQSNPLQSKMLSESMIQTNIYRIASSKDQNIKNEAVKSRIQNMPILSSSRARSRFTQESEYYLQSLKAKYVGQTEAYGVPHGFGKLYFDNGDYLEGMFDRQRCYGQGRFIKNDGSFYEGDFKNNVADGYGIYVGNNGYKYQGQWKNNMHNGSGESTLGSIRYVGEFMNNQRHGKGTLYQGGNMYQGQFKNNLVNGNAIMQRQNGERYEGQWKNSLPDGQGIYEWPDGSQYKGHYKEGKRHGKGRMIYADGSSYQGQWKEGRKNGEGEFKNQKQHFIGTFKDGVLQNIIN